jgi:hypothetical protein
MPGLPLVAKDRSNKKRKFEENLIFSLGQIISVTKDFFIQVMIDHGESKN